MGIKGIFKNSCIILCSEVKAIFALFSFGKEAELVGKRALMEITFSPSFTMRMHILYSFRDGQSGAATIGDRGEAQENKVDDTHRSERQKTQHNRQGHIGNTTEWWSGVQRQK